MQRHTSPLLCTSKRGNAAEEVVLRAAIGKRRGLEKRISRKSHKLEIGGSTPSSAMSAANKKGGRAMAKKANRTVGTDDLIGATITHVDGYAGAYGSYVVRAEKDGTTYELSANEEWGTCMCYNSCSCAPSIYFTTAIVE